jgi:hypothetical protein
MADPREAHKFDPNGRGLCSVCRLPKNILEHKRWQEKEYEEAEVAYHALLNEGRAEEEEHERVTRDGARRVKIGDRVYWHDPEDGERSGFYAITSMRTEEYISVTGKAKEEAIFSLERDELEEISEYYLDFPPFPPGWVPVKDGRDKSYPHEEVVARHDRMLDSWAEAARKRNHARDALADYE